MEKSTSKRFFLRRTHVPSELFIGGQYILSNDEEEIFHQLTKVFRLKQGQKIILINPVRPHADVQNFEYHFQVLASDKRTIQLQLLETKALQKFLQYPLALGLCLPNKPAKLDFILEKATELGVSHFFLIKSDLSQFPHQLRMDRLLKIVTEASEQSEQINPPELTYVSSLDEYLKLPTEDLSLVALERTSAEQSLVDLQVSKPTRILIGPEGGFSEREVQLLQNSNQQAINIGGHILKMDTAALLSVGILALKLQ